MVLESGPVIRVNDSYFDPTFNSEGRLKENVGLNFRLEDLSAEDELLKQFIQLGDIHFLE